MTVENDGALQRSAWRLDYKPHQILNQRLIPGEIERCSFAGLARLACYLATPRHARAEKMRMNLVERRIAIQPVDRNFDLRSQRDCCARWK